MAGSGATKTFSVRVRVIFHTPSGSLRNVLLRREERNSALPSEKSQGCMCTHWPSAVVPFAWNVNLFRRQVMAVEDQRRIGLAAPETLEMLADRGSAHGAAELVVVIFADAFPDGIFGIELHDQLDALGIVRHAEFGVRRIAQEHIARLDAADVGFCFQSLDTAHQRRDVCLSGHDGYPVRERSKPVSGRASPKILVST